MIFQGSRHLLFSWRGCGCGGATTASKGKTRKQGDMRWEKMTRGETGGTLGTEETEREESEGEI